MKDKNAAILVVDDNEDILFAADLLLKKSFAKVDTLASPATIDQQLQQHDYDVVLLDMNFTQDASSGKEGLAILQRIKAEHPDIEVVLITAYGGMELAIEAMKLGAGDFVVKPWHNERLLTTVHSALERRRTRHKIQVLEQTQVQLVEQAYQDFDEFIGNSDAMQAIKETIQRAASTDANILLTGESGTGKGVAAHTIHKLSKRYDKPFMGVDVGALTESLFESELFGHKKGAFTGADNDQVGRFEAAQNGTLFLDEIGNLALSLQVKLLGALQNRQIVPVGGRKAIDVDIRLICATNDNLQDSVSAGQFRQDLLYRINTVEIRLPALRERRQDIPLLVDYFLRRYAKKYRREPLRVSDNAMQMLSDWHWPGNVRELQHLMERATILTSGDDLSTELLFPNGQPASPELEQATPLTTLNLEELEKQAVLNAMRSVEGNISKAAKVLGINRASLYRRLNKFEL
ncbi:sigma-54-dependent transcriptional regulator [Idiomarina xiamenensis]|uniref:Two component, sigma54 specific, transcriptional regulator, fis family protein n=1 Tax=Idiomarina xiamenensis 10-D-4 TaxID=740709 RepID=K2JZQ4_9GAMM|nr:sigma-54 dependent transcriptional regulator [Idiomarina xiamenensis]EKE80933.1 two component, sigma54 specific, transcriptional regulator, fis family protein [Idiomarina xiamenensis 10-D-4]